MSNSFQEKCCTKLHKKKKIIITLKEKFNEAEDDEIQCSKIPPNLYQSKLKLKTTISANLMQLARKYVPPNDIMYYDSQNISRTSMITIQTCWMTTLDRKMVNRTAYFL